MYIYIIYIYIHSSYEVYEVAIESFPEWDLSPRPLNSKGTQSQLCTPTPNFIVC